MLRNVLWNNVKCAPLSANRSDMPMTETAATALWKNFLGPSPTWYKRTIIAFLLINPVMLMLFGPFVTG